MSKEERLAELRKRQANLLKELWKLDEEIKETLKEITLDNQQFRLFDVVTDPKGKKWVVRTIWFGREDGFYTQVFEAKPNVPSKVDDTTIGDVVTSFIDRFTRIADDQAQALGVHNALKLDVQTGILQFS